MCWWCWASHLSKIFYLLRGLPREVSFANMLDIPSSWQFDRALLATIRDKGLTPCPRCLVEKSKLDKLGLVHDMAIRERGFRQYLASKVTAAQHLIYNLAKPIAGAGVEGLLKDFSGVPTKVRNIWLINSEPTDSCAVERLCWASRIWVQPV